MTMKSSGVASGSNFDRGIRSITTSLQRRRIQHAVAAFLVFTFVGQSSFWRNSTSSAIRTEYKTNADRSTHASKSASDVAETDQLLPFVSNICEFLEDDMAEDRHDQDNIMEDVKLCTSEVFDFTYIRNVGKLGGTYIQKLYLIPVLCKILPEVTNSTLSESQTKLFGGASVPSDCEKTLARKRWLECGSFNLLDDPTPILGRSLVFTAVRNPYMRSVSIYKYIVEKFESKSHKTVMNFTECFGGYHESLDACLADKGNGEFHWKEQVSALQPICSAMKLQRRQQKHQLLHSSTTNSNEIIAIPTEHLVTGLDTVIENINMNNLPNFTREVGVSLPLPSRFSGVSKVNAVRYGEASWLQYFKRCGQRCINAHQNLYFPGDTALLQNIYGFVNNASDLPTSY